MPAGFQPIHPRKLHATLMAIPSPAERARTALEFLCGCTGAVRGCLFLARGPGLYPAASSDETSPSPDLEAEVARAWSEELESESESDDSRTRTVEIAALTRPEASLGAQLWTSNAGVKYIRHVLGTYQRGRWTPVGIAMLEPGAKLTTLRHAYVEVVCNAFIAAGDVTGVPADL